MWWILVLYLCVVCCMLYVVCCVLCVVCAFCSVLFITNYQFNVHVWCSDVFGSKRRNWVDCWWKTIVNHDSGTVQCNLNFNFCFYILIACCFALGRIKILNISRLEKLWLCCSRMMALVLLRTLQLRWIYVYMCTAPFGYCCSCCCWCWYGCCWFRRPPMFLLSVAVIAICSCCYCCNSSLVVHLIDFCDERRSGITPRHGGESERIHHQTVKWIDKLTWASHSNRYKQAKYEESCWWWRRRIQQKKINYSHMKWTLLDMTALFLCEAHCEWCCCVGVVLLVVSLFSEIQRFVVEFWTNQAFF